MLKDITQQSRMPGIINFTNKYHDRDIVPLNTLRPRQDGSYFADDVLKCIFLNENLWISLKIPLKFVPKGPINTIPSLVQIMAWRRLGDKSLSEPMMVSLPTHICVTRPQWYVLTQSCRHARKQSRWSENVIFYPREHRCQISNLWSKLAIGNKRRNFLVR